MAVAAEQLIIFGSLLPRPRFVAAGTPGDLIVGETGEQGTPGMAAMTAGAERPLGPGLQGVERALEAEPLKRDRMRELQWQGALGRALSSSACPNRPVSSWRWPRG